MSGMRNLLKMQKKEDEVLVNTDIRNLRLKKEGAMVDKMYETLQAKIGEKLSIKQFFALIILIKIIEKDIEKNILMDSIIYLLPVLVVGGICFGLYKYLKSEERKYRDQHRTREFLDHTYEIKCEMYDLKIRHEKKRILWGGKPKIVLIIENKTNKLIEDIEGYIDLCTGSVTVLQRKIEVNYVLAKSSIEIELFADDRAYKEWQMAMFIRKEDKKVYSGPICVKMPDIDYMLIKNVFKYILECKIKEIMIALTHLWKNESDGRGKRVCRLLIIVVAIFLLICTLLLLFVCEIGIWEWIILHKNAYLP